MLANSPHGRERAHTVPMRSFKVSMDGTNEVSRDKADNVDAAAAVPFADAVEPSIVGADTDTAGTSAVDVVVFNSVKVAMLMGVLFYVDCRNRRQQTVPSSVIIGFGLNERRIDWFDFQQRSEGRGEGM